MPFPMIFHLFPPSTAIFVPLCLCAKFKYITNKMTTSTRLNPNLNKKIAQPITSPYINGAP